MIVINKKEVDQKLNEIYNKVVTNKKQPKQRLVEVFDKVADVKLKINEDYDDYAGNIGNEGPQPGDVEYHNPKPQQTQGIGNFNKIDWKELYESLIENEKKIKGQSNFIGINVSDFVDSEEGMLTLEELKQLEHFDIIEIEKGLPIISDAFGNVKNYIDFYNAAKENWNKEWEEDNSRDPEEKVWGAMQGGVGEGVGDTNFPNVPTEIFNVDTAKDFANQLNTQIKAPFVKTQISTLGGNENISVLLLIAMDKKENWNYGILENSKYARFHISNKGVIERFRSNKFKNKFRKIRVKNVQQAIDKINQSIASEQSLSGFSDDISKLSQTHQGIEDKLKGGKNMPDVGEGIIKEHYGDRYENIMFAQGDDANEPLAILNNQGEDAALEYLTQWHYPGEHDGSNELGHGTSDKVYKKDGYIMSWNSRLGYIGLQYDTKYKGQPEEQPSYSGVSPNDAYEKYGYDSSHLS